MLHPISLQIKEAIIMSELPPEIICLILEYLPLKSLLRCKCVSKTWNNLITNPTQKFIYNSLAQNKNSNKCVLAIRSDYHYFPNYVEAKEFSNDNCVISRLYVTPHSKSPKKLDHHSHLRIVGSCNGIVTFVTYCGVETKSVYGPPFYNSCYKLYFWNPFLRSHFLVPTPTPKYTWVLPNFGFGFDVVNGNPDYKIVRVTRYFEDDLLKWEAVVYSSNRNCWGLPYVVDAVNSEEFLTKGKPGVQLMNNHENVVPWLFVNLLDRELIFLRGFDLCSEKWTDLPLPDEARRLPLGGDFGADLFALEGCLCLVIDSNSNSNSDVYKSVVWVMKEYGVKESWAPFFNMSEINYGIFLQTPLLGYEHNFLLTNHYRKGRYCQLVGHDFRDKTHDVFRE